MKVIVWMDTPNTLSRVKRMVRNKFEGFPEVSPFYATGSPIRKVDNCTLRFIIEDESDISPVRVEGTVEEFKELRDKLDWAIKTNERHAGTKWEDLPEKL